MVIGRDGMIAVSKSGIKTHGRFSSTLIFFPCDLATFDEVKMICTQLNLRDTKMDEQNLLERITINPKIFGGKPIIRGRRPAVEHVLGMFSSGERMESILEGYPRLEQGDIQAFLAVSSPPSSA